MSDEQHINKAVDGRHYNCCLQLSQAHPGIQLADNPVDVGCISDTLLDHLGARSVLIKMDPSAADGHEEVMFDIVDITTLRQLVYAAIKYRGVEKWLK